STGFRPDGRRPRRCSKRSRTCAAGCETRGRVPVVSDSSPLILYSRIGRLDLLGRLFDEVIVPPAVQREVVDSVGRPGSADVDAARWIRVQALARPAAEWGI